MKNRLIITLILIGLLFGIIIFTASASLNGDDVLTKVKRANDVKSIDLTASMKLYDANDDKLEYKLKWISKKEGSYKSLIRFLTPDNLKETAFLTKIKDSSSRDMYLYSSNYKSPKKIFDSQKNDSFLKTDFSYRDLATLSRRDYNEDYRAVILQETDQQYLLQIIPIEADINYKYGKMWVTKESWYPIKIEFYNEEGKLYKILRNNKLEKKDGHWIAKEIIMENYQTKNKTVLYLEEINYNQEVSDEVFQIID